MRTVRAHRPDLRAGDGIDGRIQDLRVRTDGGDGADVGGVQDGDPARGNFSKSGHGRELLRHVGEVHGCVVAGGIESFGGMEGTCGRMATEQGRSCLEMEDIWYKSLILAYLAGALG